MAQTRHVRKSGASQPGQPTPNRVIAEYDFAVDGGLVSSITLRGDTLPSGAIIVNSLLRVETALSGGTSTAGISSEGAGDIQAAVATTGAPWSTTGPKVPTKTATSAHILTTADRALVLVIGTAALTAGKFQVIVEYYQPA